MPFTLPNLIIAVAFVAVGLVVVAVARLRAGQWVARTELRAQLSVLRGVAMRYLLDPRVQDEERWFASIVMGNIEHYCEGPGGAIRWPELLQLQADRTRDRELFIRRLRRAALNCKHRDLVDASQRLSALVFELATVNSWLWVRLHPIRQKTRDAIAVLSGVLAPTPIPACA